MVEKKVIRDIEYNSKKERISPSSKIIKGDINRNSWMSIKDKKNG